ncbi:MAG: hypothetical protein QOD72_2362 [Acidimicrobiaceae bacterium]|jgi:hypothetical protein|nr:hypothetical protein [Acidimicrobiaceae bacterium]
MSADVVRYRCTSCGNLTRFDVLSTRRTKAYHHFTTSGELTVEDVDVIAETVESVTCRWCGPSGVVEPLAESVAEDLSEKLAEGEVHP